MNFTYTKTKWDGDPAADREHFIGGSDVGTIMGMNQWKSAYTLWAEKTGLIEVPDLSDKEAVWWGNYDEEGVARRFSEKTGKKVRRSMMSYGIAEIPYLRGHIDRILIGEKAGLECKTTSAWNRTDYDSGNIPPAHYAQCQFYMLVTGFDHWYYAVKRDNRQFYVQCVDRDDEFIRNMIDACAEFWNDVQTGTAPAVDGSESTTETLSRLHGADQAKDDQYTIRLGEDAVGDLNEATKIKKLESELKKERAVYENQIRKLIGDYQHATAGDYRVSWAIQHRSGGIDVQKLKDQYPAAYADCKKPDIETRILKYRLAKEKENEDD